MSYNISYTDPNVQGRTDIVVPDQSLETDRTSLTFVGKNFPSYAKFIGENFLHLLENFASETAPTNPTIGQLWYDTDKSSAPRQPQLRIWDGTTWAEAGGIKKGVSRPAVENSILGDLWVDLANQQLYMFTGAAWTLVGPEFSEGSKSGLKTEGIIDRDTNTNKDVLIYYVNDIPVITVSKDQFYPKIAIPGFEIIRQGVTMSTQDFDLDGTNNNKYWGTSEQADALVVGNTSVPAANFLRSDVISTTNFTLNVRSGGGLVVGPSLEASFTAGQAGTVISNRTPGSIISLRTTTLPSQTNPVGVAKDVLVVSGDEKVGINKSPTEALDVVGNILSTGSITSTNTTEVNSNGTIASLSTQGGANIEKSLRIGNNLVVDGFTSIGPANYTSNEIAIVTPKTNEKFNIGSPTSRFSKIYSNRFEGTVFSGVNNIDATFKGSLQGNVTGSASYLSSTANFSLRGDVSSNIIPFNGSAPVSNKNIAFVERNSAGIVRVTTSADHNFITGYIASVDCTTFPAFNTPGSIITRISPTTFSYSQSGLGLPVVIPTAASGVVSISPGGTFVTVLNDSVIADKVEVQDSFDSDTFLVYRAAETPPLRKINKATLFSSVSTVPAGSILPFAGDTPPAGYLLCDGSEQRINIYSKLFDIIGYKYKPQNQLVGFQTFALPDLRGRFPLGRETMDNGNEVNKQTTATSVARIAITTPGAAVATLVVNNSNTVNGPFQIGKTITGTDLVGTVQITNVENNVPSTNFTTITVSMPPQDDPMPSVSGLTISSVGAVDAGGGAPNPARVSEANAVGIVGGASRRTLTVDQLPEHLHDMKDSVGNQFYSLRNETGAPPESEVINGNIHFTSGRGQLLTNSGGIKTTGSLGQPLDTLSPYLTINYIIFTGDIL
jgi:microcystin-dependent protein